MAAACKIPAPFPPVIELTEIEKTLRHLLLDVVEYIKQKHLHNGHPPMTDDLVLRFTGGWVRDKLLGVDSHDIDVGISTMTGYKFGAELKEYLDIPEHLEKYRSFHSDDALKSVIGGLHKIEANPEKSKHLETVATRIFGLEVDLVNLRKETYSDHSRHPDMEFGTAQEDALRRDATINALFYNLHTSSVEDLTGRGISDMICQIIRTPLEPYQTFKDDPLRVLRLIRFSSRLGYRIDQDTEEAMQHADIKESLRLKISQERIGAEIEKMLKGKVYCPSPFAALCIIDRLHLYDTIFSNHQDDVTVDASSWVKAKRALMILLDNDYMGIGISQETRTNIRTLLLRDGEDIYHSWMLAAFSPWAIIPQKETPPDKKDLPPRAAMVARDSLRTDNKTFTILKAAATHYKRVTDLKSSFLKQDLGETLADVRWQLGRTIREIGVDWRLCVIQAILLEVMQGEEAANVFKEYEQFLLYLKAQDLLGVDALRPLVNGRQLASAFGVLPGPWMSKALDMVIEWQLRNPERRDGKGAIEEVERRKDSLELTTAPKKKRTKQ
ncbi:CCA tRNA nucleotidyltransferase, mitochondrial [Ophidiomyces ophidiicola]|uniref:CCA tRNA nucleotidyltransferase, mitochondrial n=1 Tax=Ophidiomyces ophidiicola TaxID=1387563 RepID=A0ACB8V268_9EURO|nr:CCA tRNA nucleotidyltransferase, mitochondrial [Ophidiomyces ophidiicola]KAI1940766.1 CCA tRNA nucleotidyltransferase, mitochondrial [Ophidiomyces ophidiicola]KAI1951346.1 CCA tRNA nucleotidyltransferase, mitochondrial [Ophidiomyces ophidiicola]KAI1973022.1 CCA tRNA nucleotidyltransferase, mitochondrial [Ophidiomyces ophidiicola]KAI2006834.1 CCA tRNA nucleotidyltransferase, mitochondrial [Ophidiomyces ophidiicola]KAI2025613.1 CCA tRNA nucleotidyltransferase, mitochondrial [Ophidiomyces ophi